VGPPPPPHPASTSTLGDCDDLSRLVSLITALN